MKYKSTRNSDIRLEASEVIVKGISDEGGLFVPESLPNISALLPQFAKLNYSSLAAEIFRLYLIMPKIFMIIYFFRIKMMSGI